MQNTTNTADSTIDHFCDTLWLEDGLAKNSLDAYRRDLSLFSEWLRSNRGQSLLQASAEDLNAYFAARHATTKPASANRRLAVLKRFYHHAVRTNLMEVDPCLKLKSAKQPPRLPKTLSESQVEALLGVPNIDTALGLRDRTMLELMYASGLRVSELVDLKSLEISMNDGIVRVTGKGGKTRLVPFGGEARLWIERYLEQARGRILGRQVAEALFVTARGAGMTRQMFWVVVRKYAVAAGINGPL